MPMESFSLFLQVDTTSVGYKVGLQIGSWLPFLVIAIIALLIIVKGYRHKGEESREGRSTIFEGRWLGYLFVFSNSDFITSGSISRSSLNAKGWMREGSKRKSQ